MVAVESDYTTSPTTRPLSTQEFGFAKIIVTGAALTGSPLSQSVRLASLRRECHTNMLHLD